jgi:PiT family inorganic phosphate transporter
MSTMEIVNVGKEDPWAGCLSPSSASSSHAIIGGLVGAGLAAGGLAAINWGVVRTAVIAIVVSPAVAFTVAFLAMVAMSRLQHRLRIHDDAKGFKALQLVSAAAVSFGQARTMPRRRWGSWPRLCWPAGTSPCGRTAIFRSAGGFR